MPIAKVQLPDGRIGRFNVPEGTTPEQVLAFAESNLKEPATPTEKPTSDMDTLGFFKKLVSSPQGRDLLGSVISDIGTEAAQGVGKAGRAVGTGAARALDIPIQAANLPINIANMAGADLPTARMPSEAFQTTVDDITGGALQPQNAIEKGLATAGEFAGGAGVFNAASRGSQMLQPLVSQGTGAAASLAGAGAGTQIAQEMGGGAVAQVAGGVIGSMTPSGLSKVSKLIATPVKTTKRLVVGGKADEILAKSIRGQSARDLSRQLREGEISSLADVGGDTTRGLTRALNKKGGEGRKIIEDFLIGRSEGSQERIAKVLSKEVSGVDTFFGNLDDIAKARSAVSAPIYKRAYEAGANLDDAVSVGFYKDPRIVAAYKQASRDFGLPKDAKATSLETFDAIKKSLDDTIGEAIRVGKNEKARSYQTLKNSLVSHLDDQVPAYKQARDTFAGFKSLEDAQLKGRDFTKMQPEQLRKQVKRLTPSERDAYLIGVRQKLTELVDRTADGGDPAKRIFGNTQIRKQIKAALPNEGAYREFEKRMREEIMAAETKLKVLGNSRSDYNLADDGAELIEAAMGNQSLKSQITDVIAVGIKNRYIGINDKNAADLAKALTNKQFGQEALTRIINSNKSQVQKEILINAGADLPKILAPTMVREE